MTSPDDKSLPSSIEPTKGQLRAMLSAWFGRGYTHDIDEEVPEFVERMKAVYAAAEFVAARSATLPPEPTEKMIRAMDATMWEGSTVTPGTIEYEHWCDVYRALLAATDGTAKP